MITNNGYTWLEGDEIDDAYSKIRKHFGPNADQVRRPWCEALRRHKPGEKAKPCHRVTTYVVFTTQELRKKVPWLGMGGGLGVYKVDDLWHYPMSMCVACEAAEAGYVLGLDGDPLNLYDSSLAGIEKAPLSVEDIKKWKDIFRAAYTKGAGTRSAQAADRLAKNSKSRYIPKTVEAPQ